MRPAPHAAGLIYKALLRLGLGVQPVVDDFLFWRLGRLNEAPVSLLALLEKVGLLQFHILHLVPADILQV